MILVSKRMIFSVIGFLLGLTFLLMLVFLNVDFDYLLGRKDLAMKVGQTTITLSELNQIQAISGIQAKKLDAAAFASEFFDTLLYAEGGRRLGLDRRQDFIRKVAVFDQASARSDDKETLARAVFLIEELAAAARREVAEADFHPAELTEIKVNVPVPEQRLHLKTILVAGEEEAQQLLAERAEGVAFADLNASWSRSLYHGVGGDIGWKKAGDFPENVFAKLLTLEPEVLTQGFVDESGVHLYAVVSRPKVDPAQQAKAERELQLRELRRRRLMKYIVELRNSVDYWVNPVLQARCQTLGRPGAADSSQ
jgi:parvulin-like peptidyl-prolyl isomerase